ncbi:MAG: EhbH [Methanobrevibacter sp.]|nr:EhbH [Methanobrevibacter sp.]
MSNDDKSNNVENIEDNDYKGIRTLILSISTALFALTLFDVMYGFKSLINPGISKVYNALGTPIQPNMVTLVVFDWRAYDTLGEALILVTAVVIVLLVFGRGLVEGNSEEDE